MKINSLKFRHTYSVFPCFFKKNLPIFLFENEKSVRESMEEYQGVSVELMFVKKVSFLKYLAVWKVTFLER